MASYCFSCSNFEDFLKSKSYSRVMIQFLDVWVYIPILSLVHQQASPETMYNETCCKKLGCFRYLHPYTQRTYTSPLVMCPEDELMPTLRLYRRGSIDNPQTFVLEEETVLSLDKKERAIFIVHDYKESGTDQWVMDMMRAILQKESANLFIYDWKAGAQGDFSMAASNTRSFGAYLGEMMDYISLQFDIAPRRMWCIGFGMGAHLCSLAMGRVVQRIERITGLDPTGPEFDNALDPIVGLNILGANFVDVIHTSSDTGSKRKLGDTDFFPNGGQNQPRCSPGNDACDHESARVYFQESINNNCFGTSRKFRGPLSTEVIKGAHRIYMGYLADMYTSGKYIGTYDVGVVAKKPFCDPWAFNDTTTRRVNKLRKTRR